MKAGVFLQKRPYQNIFYDLDLPLIYAIQIFHFAESTINFISRKNVVSLLPLHQVFLTSHSYVAALEVESSLRRSRVEAELAASRAVSEAALRRSRVEA